MGHEHEHLNSGNTEYFTPQYIVLAARKAMGGIDLDPASCYKANRVVHARHIYTQEDDGLSKPWFGRVWMNHPFSKGEKACPPTGCTKKACARRGYHIDRDLPGNAAWINRLVHDYRHGKIEAACCITWASMAEEWFRPLLAFPQCFPYGRVNYLKPDGVVAGSANKGSVITYLGEDLDAFAWAFKHIGQVKVAFTKRP